MNLFDIKVESIEGLQQTLEEYKGNVILIVNIASKCGYTPQLTGLEELYKKYHDKGFVVLGFPCNQFLRQAPGTNTEILNFCQQSYGVHFPIFAKLNVKGLHQSELYKYLTHESPVLTKKKVQWNFEKFLIDREGNIVNRYLPKIKPKKLEKDIEEIL